MEEAAEYLLQCEPTPVMECAVEPIGQLMDDITDRVERKCIVSHHMRLFLLSLAGDYWVQERMIVERKVRPPAFRTFM
jgi:hypothetical protein